jgi:predicted Zn-dependent protease
MTRQNMIRQVIAKLLPVVMLGLTAGCATNPVTGKSEFMVVSEAQELELGKQNYAPMQQAQGGVYDVDPELTQYVQQIGDKLAAVSDRPLPYEFVVLNNSVPNAWALPGGKIAINRGLLTELGSEAELAAVLGHEIVHAAAKHSAKQMSRGVLLQGAVLATAVMAGGSDYGDLAVGGASVGAQLLNSTYGRDAELESDLYGMTYMSRAGYDPSGAVTLQETFVRLSEGRDSDWLSGLFASHPPSQSRVDANVRTAASLPAGGVLGVENFEAAMKNTRAALPAYEAHDEGRKALANKQYDEALARASEAIRLFPEEANFYALRGDIRQAEEQYGMAVTNYDSAIRRRDNYFYYYLQRGLSKYEMGSTDSAVSDLERSIEFLPTAPAHYTLGNIESARGSVDAAIEHYGIVAKGGGDYGKAASGKLIALDLPRNPGRYIPYRCYADSSGNLVVAVMNESPVAIKNVQFAVNYTDNAGVTRQLKKIVPWRIEPSRVKSTATGLGPYDGATCPVTILAAELAD